MWPFAEPGAHRREQRRKTNQEPNQEHQVNPGCILHGLNVQSIAAQR
jgi:hypothetical protein